MARFVVGSVTGWSIRKTSREAGPPPTCWYVLDSAYCYRVVREFVGNQGRNKYERRTGEERALALAADLNAEDERC